ncbi:alpha/beta hydrolase-fold protein [Subsaxibacter sp. CAU 1640]|uniref:alpha/beta hydrolase n=1 Tax=Subsaxibacter sp. CAU 1640 TaxID=2933271 RepID=UPI002003B576|nr:alpha/beta hydrolase-fold protein [Subsaxibacter sp. CAU 1640]MCK7589716.1 alpha/beta hydrolase-fold protein [Subsaxibacter sp. CAU 1640]
MKKALTFIACFMLSASVFAQIKYEKFESRTLNTTRELKIKLPKNYDPSSGIKHPVIVVFDGDYLFEPVVGQVSYQTYFDGMPESIVVGVVQGYERFYDSYFDEVTGLPIESGARFYQFVGEELIPYIDSKYNTSKFRVAIGHDIMGNFINSFMFSDKPVFQAYINLSPDFKGNMNDNIANRVKWVKDDVFYYLATSDDDIPHIRKTVEATDVMLKSTENKALTYYFDKLEGDSHYTMVTGAISKAMDQIFDIYKPLDEKELTEKVLTYEGTLDHYIEKRYNRIEDLFGIHKPIPEEEFEKVVKIAEEREDLESLEKLGKLANKNMPKSSLGTYYLALHAERIGKTKKATKLYEEALTLEETPKFNKEFIMAQVEKLKFVAEETEEKVED